MVESYTRAGKGGSLILSDFCLIVWQTKKIGRSGEGGHKAKAGNVAREVLKYLEERWRDRDGAVDALNESVAHWTEKNNLSSNG